MAHTNVRRDTQDIIRTHDLIALNTWGPQGKRSCTFLPAGPSGHSQIDFAIARRGQADPVSRTVAPKTVPFVPVTGMRHLPLLGSVPFPTRPTAPTQVAEAQGAASL